MKRHIHTIRCTHISNSVEKCSKIQEFWTEKETWIDRWMDMWKDYTQSYIPFHFLTVDNK